MDVHGEDEVEDVWGREVGASTAGWSVYLVGSHGGDTEFGILDDVCTPIEADLAQVRLIMVKGETVSKQ